MGRQASGRVTLREVERDDLSVLFEHQADPRAAAMAAFASRDRAAFLAHWDRILVDDRVFKRTIVCDGEIAGHVVCFEQSGRRLVGYWVGRERWGRGIATTALRALLAEVRARPLHAIVARSNRGSIRVLEKCGFRLSGQAAAPAPGGGAAIEEFVYTLDRV